MCYFLHSSGASDQTDRFSHLWGVGACWSSSGDWGCVSVQLLFRQQQISNILTISFFLHLLDKHKSASFCLMVTVMLLSTLYHITCVEIKITVLWSPRFSENIKAPSNKWIMCKSWMYFECYSNLNNLLCVFQPHVHGDERSAEDERQHCYKRHAGKI